MTLVAEKLDSRDVYEVSGYDEGVVLGETITAVFTNPEDGDTSDYHGANDGKFIVTVAKGYAGSAHVVVTGSDGGEDSGSVSFGG